MPQLQACSAVTLAPGSAALLTGLLLTGNTPSTSGVVLTPSLYWVVLPCAMADILVALHLGLQRAREQQQLQQHQRHPCSIAPASTGEA